jgi:Flp pilus assembly protein TadD
MRHTAKAIRYAIAGALAASLLAGCSASSHLASASSREAASHRQHGTAVAGAEAMVAQAPADAAARMALAQIYLEAGRFRSAATTFQDAITLGETSGRAQLSLALAQIGAGDAQAAVAVLDGARDAIPAADRGLALALAGETSRGIAILVDAVRGGENTAKVRQNLAYAFALDGRWREARLTMAQDVPADQIDNRIGEWASMAQPEAVQLRVASLLGVPVTAEDPGQPAALALGATTGGEQLAAAQAPAPVAPAGEQLAAAQAPAPVAPAGELPAVDDVPAAAPAVAAAPAAAPAPTAFAEAFAAAPAAVAQPGFISQPVVQPIPAASRPVRAKREEGFAPQAAAAPRPASRATAAAPRQAAAANGTHLVQLGSFSSEASARRAWRVFTARNPELRSYRMTITPATVNGKDFWRVAAAGLDGGTAQRVCAGVRNRGGACLAYAASAVPGRGQRELAMAGAGAEKARRR